MKIRGRLGAVREQDFVLLVTQKKRIQERTVSFADVKSVEDATGRTAVWIVLGALVGVVVLIAVLRHVID